MGFFTYSAKQFTSIDQLSLIQKIQIVTYLNFVHTGKITRKHQKRYNCSKQLLIELMNYKVSDLIDAQAIPSHLRGEDMVFHPHIENDYHPCDLGPNNNWDSYHYGEHLRWTEVDCFTLLLKLFDENLELIRISKLDSSRNTCQEAIEYIMSDLNKVFFQFMGFDHDEFCEKLLPYKEHYDQYVSKRLYESGTGTEDNFFELDPAKAFISGLFAFSNAA